MDRSRFVALSLLCCGAALAVVPARVGRAANPPAAAATRPADPADQRLTFLTLQLSSTEESIKAINTALKVAGYKSRVAEDRAAIAEKGNELMDRKGGAPVPWDKFYGRTAGHFIVRIPPVYKLNVNQGSGPGPTTYITNDPVRRPAQFDYLYKANTEQAAKAKQQVDAMGRKVETLLARRRQLEDEQVALWATIALETIGNREIAARPVYRFRLKPAAAPVKPADDARAEIMRAAALFLRTADRAAANAAEIVTGDPSAALKSLKDAIAPAEAALRDAAVAQQDVAAPASHQAQQLKDLLAAAKRAQLLCKNVTDAHRLALDGDSAGDEPRKQMFRGQLQESLLGLADAVGELDDGAAALAAAWDVKPEAGVDAKYPLPGPVERTATPERKTPGGAPAVAPADASTMITVHASAKVNVLTLERGAPRLYDSNPLRRIEGFDPSLNGWQFVSIPQRVVIKYAVHVNKAGTLYAFGKQGDFDQIFGGERGKWEPAGGAIEGKNVGFAFRRRVTAGEDLAFGGFEVQIAAESISLGDAKPGGSADAGRAPGGSAGVGELFPGVAASASLFDGHSLAGWEGDAKAWSVSDGAIRGVSAGKEATYLFSRGVYRNFVLDAEFKFLTGNTGILFRAEPGPGFGFRTGYEADLFVPNAVGKLALNDQTVARPDAELQKQVYRPREWNRYTIEADGDRIRLSINGQLMTDTVGGDVKSGHIALQLSGPTEVYFRNLSIRELP